MPTDLMPGKATAAADADRRGADTTVDRDAAGAPFHQGRRFLADLDDRSEAFGYIGPNLFASVMGTGIVANAAATLPFHVPGLIDAARAVWVLDVVLLAVIGTATVAHWALFPDVARGHLRHPVMAHFYGAPAMALMTVGAGALLVGRPVVGDTAAVAIAATLWIAGTLFGLATAVVVPLKAFSDRPAASAAFGGWLMPVVPPMVSAATGPLLITHLPAGQWRLALLLCCAAMFGLTLIASLVVITLICARLMHHGPGAAASVPTLWIVLGPLGQSITAAHAIGLAAPGVLLGIDPRVATDVGLLYGVPVWGFTVLWIVLAAAITVRTARTGLPFNLTWWSFTFPVGTVVTGTSGLAASTRATFLVAAAGFLYAGLVTAWVVVAARTARGVYRGTLLRAPA